MSSIVVVTVTKIQSGAPTAHSTSTSSQPTSSQSTSSRSDLSSGAIAGIVIGSLIAGTLFIVLVLYFFNRYSRRKPTRASNPAHDRDPTAGGSDYPYLELPRTRPFRYTSSSRRSLRPSFSSEPLLSSDRLSHSTLPSTPRVQTPSTPPRLDSVSLDVGDAPFSSWDITHPVRSDSVSHLEGSATPPVRDEDKTPLKPQQSMFVHRMLQSRARASEGLSLEHCSSIPSRSTTLNSSTAQPDEERLLANAERAALRDAGMDERVEEDSRVNWIMSAAELPPVPEVPDIPRAPMNHPVTAAVSSSLHGQVPHGTVSPPVSFAVEPLPLLTSANFGKTSTTSGTPPGSMSSKTGWGSNSSGTASRYPSLATSSMGMSSRSGPRSDCGTPDWHHPPTGLAGLKTLQIGSLHNPHSPVDEHPLAEVSLAPSPPDPPAPVKRAHLREGTTSSVAEVERRGVTQGVIAHIDVSL
ncbi:hypothetical protein JVU11DRAFT_7536 [Chiua virens]|nr:hypothetical protein JVU11DRAFT_7536 [Chiua virens]